MPNNPFFNTFFFKRCSFSVQTFSLLLEEICTPYWYIYFSVIRWYIFYFLTIGYRGDGNGDICPSAKIFLQYFQVVRIVGWFFISFDISLWYHESADKGAFICICSKFTHCFILTFLIHATTLAKMTCWIVDHHIWKFYFSIVFW